LGLEADHEFGARWEGAGEAFKPSRHEVPPEVMAGNSKRLRQWVKTNLWVHGSWLKLDAGQLRERLAGGL
jgi:hypothetical protein